MPLQIIIKMKNSSSHFTVSICKNIELHIVYNCKLIVVYICSFIMIQERYFPPKLVEDQLNHWGNKLAPNH